MSKFLPHIVFFTITLINLLMAANKHGKPRLERDGTVERYSFWITLGSSLLYGVISWWMGAFDVFCE